MLWGENEEEVKEKTNVWVVVASRYRIFERVSNSEGEKVELDIERRRNEGVLNNLVLYVGYRKANIWIAK